MSKNEPTVEMDKPKQPADQEKPTVLAGQEADQAPPSPGVVGAPFQPTSPQQHQTPASPPPFRPAQVPGLPRTPDTPADATVMMQAERVRIPLAWIAVVEGTSSLVGYVHTLGPETVVGRTAGDLVLGDDPSVSGQHLKIKFEMGEEEEQEFVLYDLASSNGTFVGDRETYQDDESRIYRHVLHDGDFILVGQTTLVFKRI